MSRSLLLIYINKSEKVIHIRNLNQALNHGKVLKKVHRVITFNQKSWIKKKNLSKNICKNYGKYLKNIVTLNLVTTEKK